MPAGTTFVGLQTPPFVFAVLADLLESRPCSAIDPPWETDLTTVAEVGKVDFDLDVATMAAEVRRWASVLQDRWFAVCTIPVSFVVCLIAVDRV